MTNEGKHFYEFGPYRIDPEERLLLRGQEPVPLPPKAFETLLILVNRSERVVPKDDLMKTLWPDTFVEEANLSQNIFVLRKALGETAQDPRYIVTVAGRGYRFAQKVSQVTDKAAAEELVVSSQTQVQLTVRTTETSIASRLIWLGLAVVVTLGGFAAYRSWSHRASRSRSVVPSATSLQARPSIAVLGFRNLSGRSQDIWLSTAIAEMLNTELAAGEKLRLVPGEDMARAKHDLPVADADSLSKDTLARLRKRLGTDAVVLGSFTALGDSSNKRIRLDLRLQDAVAGETKAEVSATGTEANLFELVSQAGARLREKLGLEAVSLADAVSVRASLPDNPEAARRYAQGLDRLRVFEPLAARDLLQEAVAADPKYPLSHAALAEAWTYLGYDKKAKEEATQAFQLSGKLSREDRLAVEARFRFTIHDYKKAVEVYRSLFTLFPDNLEYGLRLAESQDLAGQSSDAIITLETLRKLPLPLSNDPRIDLRVAAATSDADHAKALAADEEAIKKGTALGAKQLVARARGNQCANRVTMGELSAATDACRQAREAYASAGDWNGVGKELNDSAFISIQQGKMSEARKLFTEALEKFRGVGNDAAIAAAMMNLAVVIYYDGELREAKKLFSESVPRYRKVEDIDGEAQALINVAAALADQGDFRASKAIYKQAMEVAEPINDKHAEGYAMAGLGDPLLREGDLAGARKAYEQSLAIRTEIGEKQTATESRVYLAALTLEEGHPAEAEKAARECLKLFHDEQQDDDELIAASVLVGALLAQSRVAEAQAVATAESSLAAKNQNYTAGPRFAIVAAQAMAASGNLAEGQSRLQSILLDATRKGFLEYQFEVRLALADIELRSGHTAAARAHLASLAKDAKAKNFNLISKKAAVRTTSANLVSSK